jgi:hypothetical protein
MTAAMNISNEEFEYPWHCWEEYDDNSSPLHKIHGISVFAKEDESLFCDEDDLPIGDEKWDPFVTMKEDKGNYKIPLQKYVELVNEREPKHQDSPYGILVTGVSHLRPRPSSTPSYRKPILKAEPPLSNAAKKEGKKASKQTPYFCFVLEKGTDLMGLGMALVYDNLEENHCSLVRTSEEWNEEPWQGDMLLQIYSKERIDITTVDDERLTGMLTSRGNDSKPVIFPKAANIDGSYYFTFPYLAAKFRLHSFVLKAMAEPILLEEFEDDDAFTMYKTALLLFSAGGPHEVIQMLELGRYQVDSLPGSSREYLLRAVDGINTDNMTSEECDVLFDAAYLLR